MRLALVFLIVELAGASNAWSHQRLSLADRMYCDYVAEFAPQIARNKIREVPYLRLDEFHYFDEGRSQFLKRVADEIYSQDAEVLRRSLNSLNDIYAKECRDAFSRD